MICVIEERSLLHPVLLRHLVAVQQAAGAPPHRPWLVFDPFCHAARLDYLRVSDSAEIII